MQLKAIQQSLLQQSIDAWLFCDFHHRDAIAYRVLGLPADGIATRRWYYLVSATGQPVKLVHRIESEVLDSLPGEKRCYASWKEREALLREILEPSRVIAMQYSPENQIPYISLVDAGTVELVRSFGKQVITSANLVQEFEARWSAAALESHLEAGRRIHATISAAFAEIAKRIESQGATDEYAIQQFMVERFERDELTMEGEPPIVAVNANSGNPHYETSRRRSSPIRAGDFVLLDVWGKRKTPGAVYYDVTWVGFAGANPPAEIERIFRIVAAARDTAIEKVTAAIARKEILCGWEVDRAARGVIEQSGYGDFFPHRTGHSIGESVHGNGANMDDLEIHDERAIIAFTAFSIEPGIYLPEFGIRSEVDIFVDEHRARVTGPIQNELIRITMENAQRMNRLIT